MVNINVRDIIDIGMTVTKALNEEAKKSTNDLTQKQVPKVANDVTNKIEAQVKAQVQPVIDHALNQEPWYQSRVTWGAIIAAVAGVAGIAGFTFTAEDQQFWVDNIAQGIELGVAVASLIGGAIAWYGRWRAKKPIGQ